MSKRVILLSAVFAFGVAALAQAAKNSQVKETKEEREARIKRILEFRDRKTGGFIRRIGVPDGKIVIANANSGLDMTSIKKEFSRIANLMKTKIEVVDVSNQVSVATAGDALGQVGAAVAVFIVNDDKLPATTLIAPSAKWAIVNTKALGKDGAKPAYVNSRTCKEAVRSMLIVSGGFNSQFPDSLMSPVVTLTDLDDMPAPNPPVDVMGRAVKSLPKLGVTPNPFVTYLQACQEGWAPAPTNEYQKAIWEKVHAPPTKPLKITYDKDGQKPVVK